MYAYVFFFYLPSNALHAASNVVPTTGILPRYLQNFGRHLFSKQFFWTFLFFIIQKSVFRDAPYFLAQSLPTDLTAGLQQ